MALYVILDAGMGGLVVFIGGGAVLVFAIAAFFILRASIRTIKREIEEAKEDDSDNDEYAETPTDSNHEES